MQFVPVVDSNQRPLMPTTPARAERWMKSGKATPFFRKGIFCVRLNVEPSHRHTQPIAIGIDPGSKREGYTVKSKSHTFLNQQFHAVDWVKDAEETSTNGGSMSQGLKRGGIVKHPKYGSCFVGGEDIKKSRISLHSLDTGKRLCQNAKPTDCKFLAYNSWRTIKPS